MLLDAPLGAEISIERFDDVAFESEGSAQELLQTKHHLKGTGSLTDASSDLWKTLRVWSESLLSGTYMLPDTVLSLITTGIAPERSIASRLRPGLDRDVNLALTGLLEVCNTSQNAENRPCYEAFLRLSDAQQLELVRATRVIDGSPDIEDVPALIESKLRFSVRPNQVLQLRERLEGWWFSRVVDHFRAGARATITVDEVQGQILDLAQQFRPDALPIDFLDAMPPAGVSAYNTRQFVQQLRLIVLSSGRIERAIRDFYKAYAQRSRWVREELLGVGELDRYETRLMDEWGRYRDMLLEALPDPPDEQALRQAGVRLYNWMEIDLDLLIRPNCTERYVMRGSYHMLADEMPPRVGWHPQFEKRLEESGWMRAGAHT